MPQGDATAGGNGGGERRGSLSLAALSNLKGLGAKMAAGVGGTASAPAGRRGSRKSVVLPGSGSPEAPAATSPTGGLARARRSSVAASLAGMDNDDDGPTGTADVLPAGAHPGLDRIKSFNRKKSAFRGSIASGAVGAAAARAAQFDELAAAMETLDARIGGALAAVRNANAAGLGAVRGLAHSRSGRMRLASVSSFREGGGGSTGAGGGTGGAEEDVEEYSPRQLLGDAAAQRLEKFLPRVKFNLKAEVGAVAWCPENEGPALSVAVT